MCSFLLFGDAHHVRSRKRRSSPSSANGAADVIMDEDEDSDVMDECAAAMVLMRLSCSPHSPRWEGEFYQIKMGVLLLNCVIMTGLLLRNRCCSMAAE